MSSTATGRPTPDPAFHWNDEAWGSALVCTRLQSVAEHVFTTKQLALRPATTGDVQLAAWEDASASVGAALSCLRRVKQVHGRGVRVVRRGQSTPEELDARPEADAIVSNEPGLALAVQVADCVPVLMADRRSGAAAAVHAGWRGTCAGIAAAAVETMQTEFATRPADLIVAIGPSIGACCYEVGEELIAAFRAAGTSEDALARWFTRAAASLRLDLWAANTDQLLAAGVAARHIHVARLCTQTHADVFESYRAHGVGAGRMAALIRVPHV